MNGVKKLDRQSATLKMLLGLERALRILRQREAECSEWNHRVL